MTNEVLCKFLCHNLTCLIHEQETLGIAPIFWNDEPADIDGDIFADAAAAYQADRRYNAGMATSKQKELWAIVAAILLAILIAGYQVSALDRLPKNVPLAAKLGFIICSSVGAACCLLWGVFPFLAEKRPGVRWPQANANFDFPWFSSLYTDEGMRTLRKGRNCFLFWLLLWATGVAIIAVSGGFR